ncbi:MAG: hypothetical protein SPLUMA2_SPLUMAMAG2_00780 [uncultured Sulfurimonas sp.]|nr:MAG: hypothetical protein SPLUMA1_SPLUMAMAG1_00648 [uncultured Sulfurimonas sp.]CAI6158730.1 MAG: hypothetical protein SPLUMA2_SPLUMAMAG2_00780 [uncultured Sulfurimonas sp.]
MQVAQYTFQSPSPSQVQVGRLNPSSVTNPILAEAQSFEATQVQEVKPSVTVNSIDVYA